VETADLLVQDAELPATVDDARREVPGGWVAVAGALSDPVGAWLRCCRSRCGSPSSRTASPVHPGLEEQPAVHRRVSARMQAAS
jgi:hypothetical protein